MPIYGSGPDPVYPPPTNPSVLAGTVNLALNCATPFQRVHVDWAARGVARVTWYLRPDFIATEPLYFQLQVNTNNGDPDDWVDVGSPVVNTYYATDSGIRAYGNLTRVVYRVKLIGIPVDSISGNTFCFGLLSYRQWLQAKAIMRRAILMPRGLVHHQGYLLKRKVHGTLCTCVDPYTGGITNSGHSVCNGTGLVEGYWQAAENTMFNMTPETNNDQNDPELNRQTVNDVFRTGTCLGLPPVAAKDVWISANNDKRYYIHSVATKAAINDVPIIVEAEMRLAPFSDIIYTIPLEGT